MTLIIGVIDCFIVSPRLLQNNIDRLASFYQSTAEKLTCGLKQFFINKKFGSCITIICYKLDTFSINITTTDKPHSD